MSTRLAPTNSPDTEFFWTGLCDHRLLMIQRCSEIDEGVRLVSNLCDIAPDNVEGGVPVDVFYRTFDNDVVLHQFRPAY